MKKITLLVCFIAINIIAIAQTNPCPDVQSHGLITISSSGGLCSSKIYAYATGDVGSNKSLNIKVYIGDVATGVLVVDNCFLVLGKSPSTLYETIAFSAPCTAQVTYVIGGSSNSSCSGGYCGATYTINAGPIGGPLPVSVSSFIAKRTNNTVTLNWKTFTEVNAKSFIIQRKTTGDFVDIATVDAHNIATGSSYSFSDANNYKSISQYRLKMIDIDGSYKSSEIKAVKGTATASDFTVFPNPSTGSAKVTISDISSATDVQLIDNSGRVVKNIFLNNSSTADFNGLQNGMYMIRIVNKNNAETLTKKLTVIN